MSVGFLLAVALWSNHGTSTAAPDLQLPWPAGHQHRINGGNTYDCDTHKATTAVSGYYYADYYGVDFQFGPVDGSPLDISSSAAGEVVVRRDDNDGFGNKVVVDHGDNYYSVYAHLRATNPWAPGLTEGTQVSQGQLIGYAGGTGGNYEVHLHFHMMLNSTAFRAEPMPGVSQSFGAYGYSTESGVGARGCLVPNTAAWYANGCTVSTCGTVNDPSPYWTSQAPCVEPPGGVADFALYKGETEETVYRTFDLTKYPFASAVDFESMGTAYNFWWDDIICVPNGYMAEVADIPPDKTLVREYPSNSVHVYLRATCNARFYIPYQEALTEMMGYGDANSPVRDVPPGEASDLKAVPDSGCHLAQRDSAAHWITCPGPVPFAYSKWHIWAYDVLGWLGLDGSTVRWLWSGAMNDVRNIVTIALRSECPQGDADTWSNESEDFQGVQETTKCSANPVANDEPLDAWSSDLDDNQGTNLTDIVMFGPHFNRAHPDPLYDPRFDMNTDKYNNLSDIVVIGPFMNKFCWDP